MLELREVGVWYGEHCVVRDVSLIAPRGSITALIGPSGCGKTSLLNCMNRLCELVPGCHMSGQMLLSGLDTHTPGLDLLALRKRVGMIFQKPNPFPLSIRRNVELALVEHGYPRGERASRVEQALRDAGLWDEVRERLDAPAMALSGGQKQRLCIARAIALEPEVLLMDEPCSALDPISSAVVEALILRLKSRYTVLVVTHNLAQARRIADLCGVFWVQDGSGRLIEFGTAQDIFENPRHPLTAAYVRGISG
ncbi:MAG: phosphate ABC transporter ATP-binding protein [Panacagrimonas sp.]